jgi:hypothetical protein
MFNVSTPDEWRSRHAFHLAQTRTRYGRTAWQPYHRHSDAQIAPFINHGRWIALCPACQNGMAYSPEWRASLCFGCGAEYRAEPPTDWRVIEQVLLDRPAENQNWNPGETVSDLVAENVAHGVVGMGA